MYTSSVYSLVGRGGGRGEGERGGGGGRERGGGSGEGGGRERGREKGVERIKEVEREVKMMPLVVCFKRERSDRREQKNKIHVSH